MKIRVDSIIPIKNFGMSGPRWFSETRMIEKGALADFPVVGD